MPMIEHDPETPKPASERVMAFAREQFQALVKLLVGDPSHLLHPWREMEPAEFFAYYRMLASDLGLSFDALVVEYGNAVQIERLRQIERGMVHPAPREFS